MSTSAFNSYAAEYDDHFTNSPIGILQRKRVFRFLFPLLDKQKNLLEINCGTGEDAIMIAPFLKSVLATDASPEMIKMAVDKKASVRSENLHFKISDIREVHKKLSSVFDILFSNFGGLNCIAAEDLEKFSQNISPCIAPGGKLVLVIMGRKCIWENFIFLTQKDPRLKRRRAVNGIETRIKDEIFNAFYYSPSEIEGIFSKHFKVKRVRPVGLFIPPSYLNAYFENKKWLLRILNMFEKTGSLFPFTANYADHYLMILEKNLS